MFSWRIHSKLLDHKPRQAELQALLNNWGDTVQFVDGHWRNLPAPLPLETMDIAGLCLTTAQDARSLLQHGLPRGWQLYFDPHKYDVSHWLPRISAVIQTLNRGCLFVPFGLIGDLPLPLPGFGFPMADDGYLFVRPDSGLKSFPGFSFDCRTFSSWHDVKQGLVTELRHVEPEKLVCLAPRRILDPLEWRFWVCNRQVVAGTPYSWADEQPAWMEPPAAAQKIAQQVAANPWQPDLAYVLDVVQLATPPMDDPWEGFRLNEINAASTSGLYAVPLQPLFTALRDVLARECAGELAVED